MTDNLKIIQDMIKKTKDAMSNCKPVSLKESDIDLAAKERSMLRDKLTLLEVEEQAELEVIAQEKVIDTKIRREKFLKMIISEYDKRAKEHVKYNQKIEKTLIQFFDLLKQRNALFSASDFEIFTPEARYVLSSDEQKEITDAFRHILPNKTEILSETGAVWRLALDEAVSSNSALHDALRYFPEDPSYPKKLGPVRYYQIPTLCGYMLNSNDETELDEEKDIE